jgi:hypothetical protein
MRNGCKTMTKFVRFLQGTFGCLMGAWGAGALTGLFFGTLERLDMVVLGALAALSIFVALCFSVGEDGWKKFEYPLAGALIMAVFWVVVLMWTAPIQPASGMHILLGFIGMTFIGASMGAGYLAMNGMSPR